MHEKFTSRCVRETARCVQAGIALLFAGALFAGPGLSPLPPIGHPAHQVVASWYGSAHEGRKTASGKVFHRKDMTAAHRTASFGTRLLVLYKDQAVEVEVTDRGPYAKKNGHFSRDLDLSEAAARSLGMADAGVAKVSIQEIDYPAKEDALLEQLLPDQPITLASLN